MSSSFTPGVLYTL